MVTVDLRPLIVAMQVLREALAARTVTFLEVLGRDFLARAMIKHAPQPEEERDILVRGTITKPWSRFLPGTRSLLGRALLHGYGAIAPGGFGRVGTHEEGRFSRLGPQLDLVDALRIQKMKVYKPHILQSGIVRVKARFGDWRQMAKRTGFSYIRKAGGGGGFTRAGTFKTLPFNYDWPRTANYGGTWVVVPRARGGKRVGVLHPEPGVYAREMVKTVKPYHFAEKGLSLTLGWMARSIVSAVVVPALRAAGFIRGPVRVT